MPQTGYYVTVQRGSGSKTRTGWLFGPVADHGVAKLFVPYIRNLAYDVDPFTHFDGFGTSSITSDEPLPAGVFNKHPQLFR